MQKAAESRNDIEVPETRSTGAFVIGRVAEIETALLIGEPFGMLGRFGEETIAGRGPAI